MSEDRDDHGAADVDALPTPLWVKFLVACFLVGVFAAMASEMCQ